MKRDTSLWLLGGFAFTAIGGTLLHYLYDLTGQSVLAAPFSGVNESTWEHMKLLYYSLLIFALIQSRFFKEYKGFWCTKLISTVAGLALIPALFYTYNGAMGKSPDWINIAIFFVSAALVFLLESHLFKYAFSCRSPRLAFVITCIIGILFIVFTFNAPRIPLFKDPLTGNYGI